MNNSSQVKPAALIILILANLFLFYVAYNGIIWPFITFLFFQIVALIIYFGRRKCPNCGTRGHIHLIRKQKAFAQEKRYGLVTRQKRRVNRKYNNDGQLVKSYSTDTWEERVPTVRYTDRSFYECEHCHFDYFENVFREVEDFSRDDQTIIRENNTIIREKETLRVRCNHCRSLVDPIAYSKCPNCGALL